MLSRSRPSQDRGTHGAEHHEAGRRCRIRASKEAAMKQLVRSTLLACAIGLLLAAAPPAPNIEVEDFVVTPMTGLTDGTGTNDVLLSRVNTIREEGGGSSPLVIHVLHAL